MGRRGILGWVASLVIALSLQHSDQSRRLQVHSPYTSDYAAAVHISRRVFGWRWRTAVCVARYESHWTLRAQNGVNLGPWQINVTAHPWVHPWLLTHSWRYSAKVAYHISAGGRDWGPWTTASLCGV